MSKLAYTISSYGFWLNGGSGGGGGISSISTLGNSSLYGMNITSFNSDYNSSIAALASSLGGSSFANNFQITSGSYGFIEDNVNNGGKGGYVQLNYKGNDNNGNSVFVNPVDGRQSINPNENAAYMQWTEGAQSFGEPSKDIGAFVDKKNLYDFMLIQALNNSVEVVALEIKNTIDAQPRYFVMPWAGNKSNESYPHVSDVGNYINDYTKNDVKKIFHTHPMSTPPSTADKNYSNFFKIPIYTIGANGNSWIYYNGSIKPTNLESYLQR
ncbi:MAG: hypothetical protein JSU07_08955 [Bacteroidetes bacterium]|nr:hypothetical protein [Bacteroidota bacterium]